jgi:hypothetical protein
VLVLVSYSARGKTSGLEVGQMGAKGDGMFHVRGGEVTRQVTYLDGDRARADFSLAPAADPLRATPSSANREGA